MNRAELLREAAKTFVRVQAADRRSPVACDMLALGTTMPAMQSISQLQPEGFSLSSDGKIAG